MSEGEASGAPGSGYEGVAIGCVVFGVSPCNRAFRRVSSRSGVAAEAPGGVHLGKTGYTKQCSLNVSAKDLAVMGATLADGGVDPLTRERMVDPSVCHYALAVIATAGLYETSGDWLDDIGL